MYNDNALALQNTSMQTLINEVFAYLYENYEEQLGVYSTETIVNEIKNRIEINPNLLTQPITMLNGGIGNIFSAIIYGAQKDLEYIPIIEGQSEYTISILGHLVDLYKEDNNIQFKDCFIQALISQDSNGMTAIDHLNNLMRTINNTNLSNEGIECLPVILNDIPEIIINYINQQNRQNRQIQQNQQMNLTSYLLTNVIYTYRRIRDRIIIKDIKDNFDYAEELFLKAQRLQQLRQLRQQPQLERLQQLQLEQRLEQPQQPQLQLQQQQQLQLQQQRQRQLQALMQASNQMRNQRTSHQRGQ